MPDQPSPFRVLEEDEDQKEQDLLLKLMDEWLVGNHLLELIQSI